MSYSQQNIHKLNQFIPTYIPHSDYLPTNRVVDTNQTDVQQWLANYEQQKRSGKVYAQRPNEFNPNRYVSVRTYENVIVNQPISEVQFNSRVKRI